MRRSDKKFMKRTNDAFSEHNYERANASHQIWVTVYNLQIMGETYSVDDTVASPSPSRPKVKR